MTSNNDVDLLVQILKDDMEKLKVGFQENEPILKKKILFTQ